MSPESTPFQPSSEQVTFHDQVEYASPDTVQVALDNELNRLSDQLRNAPNEAMEARTRSQQKELGSARYMLDRWKADISKDPDNVWDDFRTYVEAQAEVAIEDEDLEHPSLYAEKWVQTNYYKSVSEVIRSREQPAQFEAPAHEPAPSTEQPVVDPEKEARDKQQATEEARRSAEKAHSTELLDQIAQLTKGKTVLSADIQGAIDGMSGYRFFGDDSDKDVAIIPARIITAETGSKKWQDNLNEAVCFTNLTERDTETVTEEIVHRGRFGRKAVTSSTHTRDIPGSDRPKMILNESTGIEEPAVRFKYMFRYSNSANSASHAGELPDYREFSGLRDGQTILVGVDLPKTVADQLQHQAEDDPGVIRALVERLMLQNQDGNLTEEAWSERVRPPYEQLPTDWTISLIKNTASVTEDPRLTGGPPPPYTIIRLTF